MSSSPALRDTLLDYMLSFRPRHKECREYYINHMKRVMMLLEFISHLDRSLRILEIGAPPYNTTLALRKMGFERIDCNGYDEDRGDGPQEVRVVQDKLYSPSLDQWQYFRVAYFDVERDRWPYPDGSYDMVMGF